MRKLIWSCVGVAVMLAAGGVRAGTVYSNGFQTSDTSGWSSSSVSTTPGTVSHAADEFLGEFGTSNTVTLTLSGLATHTAGTVTFDFYAIRSVDGEGQFGGGPDGFSVSDGSTTLLSTNFANYPGNTQSYPLAGSPATTGAAEVNTLGYTFNGGPMDSVYHLSLPFTDSAATLVLTFHSSFSEDITNESWGLDNVVVTTDAVAGSTVPMPASVWGGMALLGVIGLARWWGRKISA